MGYGVQSRKMHSAKFAQHLLVSPAVWLLRGEEGIKVVGPKCVAVGQSIVEPVLRQGVVRAPASQRELLNSMPEITCPVFEARFYLPLRAL